MPFERLARPGLLLRGGTPSGFFNFLLADEPSLHGWQSGVMSADWTPKLSYQAFKKVIAEVRADRVNCAKLRTHIK
jgi:hypothetical protein